MRNVNVFTKTLVDSMIKEQGEIDAGDKVVAEQVRKIQSDAIVDFPAANGYFKQALTPASQEKYHGIDFRNNFVKRGEGIKLIDLLNDINQQVEADVLININYLQSVLNPVEFIQETLAKVKPKKAAFFKFEIHNPGQNLGDKPLLKHLPGGKVFDYKYNKAAVEKIAEQTGLEIQIVSEEKRSFAILYQIAKQPVKKAAPKKAQDKKPGKK